MTVDLSNLALLPLKGAPLPEGGVLAAGCVDAQVVNAAPWAPAKPVLDLHGGDADLVLLAVPAGLGQVLAQWIAQQIIAVEDPTGPLDGPKINGNPEDFIGHKLIAHREAETLDATRTYEHIRAAVLSAADHWGVEGIVWRHPDGRMAKLKARDFPREPARTAPSLEERP